MEEGEEGEQRTTSDGDNWKFSIKGRNGKILDFPVHSSWDL